MARAKQWQYWNSCGRCATCGGPMPATPEHTDMRCPDCIVAGRWITRKGTISTAPRRKPKGV